MVLLEAQAIGLPVVSNDCPYGPRNIITNNKDGILTDYQSRRGLADGLIQLMNNKDLRKKMGKNAQINIQKYQIENVMKSWIKLFEN